VKVLQANRRFYLTGFLYGQRLIKLILLAELGLDRRVIQCVSSSLRPCTGQCLVLIQNYIFFLLEMGSRDVVVNLAATDKPFVSRQFTDF